MDSSSMALGHSAEAIRSLKILSAPPAERYFQFWNKGRESFDYQKSGKDKKLFSYS